MNEKICLFAGTTEGRALAELLRGHVPLTVCVATEYGKVSLDDIAEFDVRAGRMDGAVMADFFAAGGFTRVIDATHPFAREVTRNIRGAAERTGLPVMRVLREGGARADGAVYVDDIAAAADYLSRTEGNILLTTGSKELAAYAPLERARLWARVLPSAESLALCGAAGIEPSRIIAAQGPFTEELNAAQLAAIGARYIVTKESGHAGGFEEKLSAAKRAGAVAVVIGRPPEEYGIPLGEAMNLLAEICGVRLARDVRIVGVGPGGRAQLTAEARAALDGCDCLIGAVRVAEAAGVSGKAVYNSIEPNKIAAFVAAHPEHRRIAAVMSGDVGFYSGAKRLAEALAAYNPALVPGISSAVYFAAKLGVPWEDAALVSAHGRETNLALTAATNLRVFALTGGENSAAALIARLCEYGLGGVAVAVGERLSYPDEKLTRGVAEELAGREFDPLSVLYVENPGALDIARHGIPDEEFIRGNVPMTKSEVRSISMSKLAPDAGAVVWDIGAGTGSVSVECAYAARRGTVYAVERGEEACGLIERNARRFHADNIRVVRGSAPEVLSGLPAPTHVFIGGSSGGLDAIIGAALGANPGARIVVNAATLETLAETVGIFKSRGMEESFEATCVSASRSKKAGAYHLMEAQNPVYVISAGGKGGADV